MNRTLEPLSAEDLKARRGSGWRIVVLWALTLITLVAVGAVFEFRLAYLATLPVALLLHHALFVGHGAIFSGEEKPLDGDGCARMKTAANEHAEVEQFLKRVNAQGRAVLWIDMWTVNTWLRQREEDEQRAACREINGLTDA